MKKLILLSILALFVASCGSSKRATSSSSRNTTTSSSNKTVDRIITHAKKFEGTRYKFGGTTKKGMDCS
ncbi:MAG: NlpC/P60 family protein, partial [Marinirhabdus sp.]|nr:NlpC/P60 family protein [Marinirhabdus sp.]